MKALFAGMSDYIRYKNVEYNKEKSTYLYAINDQARYIDLTYKKVEENKTGEKPKKVKGKKSKKKKKA